MSVKAVLLGNSGVGKTSLANRWTNGIYQKDSPTTIGANHQRKRLTFGDEEVDVFLWDTAGQEQFQAVTPLYVRSSAVAILTVAINDSSSFASLDDWTNLIMSSTDVTPPIVFAVNKIDLAHNLPEQQSEIQNKYAEKFAATFFVSAETNEAVDDLFEFAAEAGRRFARAAREARLDLGEGQVTRGGCC
jgi:small GTP-binding protein